MGALSVIRVTLVVDNLAREGLRSEHGLSFLVETDDGSVLFDTGQSGAWLHNLSVLGRDPQSIKAVAISHGHYDHTGGLAEAFREAPHARYYAHPACFEPKHARSENDAKYIGMPDEAVSRVSAFTLNTSAVEVLPGVVLSGEIPTSREIRIDTRFQTGRDEFRQDTFQDEQCVIIRSEDSTAVLVGCAHRGVENNVQAAIDIAGIGRIDLLVGGFHLGNTDEDRLNALTDFLRDIAVRQIACCHCTGTSAYEYLRSKLGSRVVQGEAGDHWEI